MADNFTKHGIAFTRTGTCTPCPGCARECAECPHGVTDGDISKCTIYDTRHLVCQECTEKNGFKTTHQICIDFPDHPWLEVIRTEICKYKFKRQDNSSMDDLPFVDGVFKKDT